MLESSPKMEASTILCGVGLLLVWFALKFLNWVWFTPKRKEKFMRNQGIKGSSYRFLIGDVKDLLNMQKEAKLKPIGLNDPIDSRVFPFERKSVDTYGDVCFTWMGPMPLIHIADPALIKEALGNHYVFQKPKLNPLTKFLASGIADAECEEWAKHRKIINPAFHVSKLKHMAPSFYICGTEMLKKWEDAFKGQDSCEVDVWPHLQTFTSDAISRTAFGSSFEEGKKVFILQLEQAKYVLDAIQSVYVPGSRFLPTKRNNRMKEIDRKMKFLIRNMIDKRIIAMKGGESHKEDLLGILLDSNFNEIKLGNKNSGLTIDEIIEECKVFYFAGQETTANLLVWTMVLLAQHTDWQAKARDEVLQVFGEKLPDHEGLSRLKIASMIFNEVLRLYPPIPHLHRMIHQDAKLGDIVFPAGSLFLMQHMFIHHNKEIWGDDANEFKPERFAESVSKVTKGQASYLPFGGGPRVCLGLNFAMLESKMALAMILQRFHFELSPSYSHAPHSVITLQPQLGAPLILRKR